LADAIERAGIGVCRTREPGGSPGGEAIRRLLLDGADIAWDAMGEALLMVAARRAHVVGRIAPALAAGDWVVCDRFADSTLAYQGYGRGLALAELEALGRLALGALVPDLTLVLDVPVEVGFSRIRARPGVLDRFERLDPAFHDRLRRGYRAIAEAERARCVLIDGTGAAEDVHRVILAAVAERLGVAGLG
jgi:dTMP kinase